MKRLSGREWKALFTLSIVVPVGFLVAFKLTGILEGPATIAETTTLESWVWERERPDSFCLFANGRDQMIYEDSEVCFYYDFALGHYDPSYFASSTVYKPVAELGVVNFTFSVRNGFVHSLQMNFTEDYQPSVVELRESFSSCSNLTMNSVLDRGDAKLDNTTKCYLSFMGSSRAAQVAISEPVRWFLKSPHNQTHNMEIAVKVTYFNGTVYKELIQPLHLTVYPDDNNSFEDADEVNFGIYEGYIGGGVDNNDFYKIQLYNENAIEITVTIASAYSDVSLYLYDPNRIERANSTSSFPGETKHIEYTANAEGYWFIEIHGSGGTGSYTITIS